MVFVEGAGVSAVQEDSNLLECCFYVCMFMFWRHTILMEKSLIMVLGMMVDRSRHRVVSDKVRVKRCKMHDVSKSPHKYRGAHVREKQSKADFEISHAR